MENILIPDVSGLQLEQAIELLTSKGLGKPIIHTTAPPRMRGAGYDGHSRVVRMTIEADDSIELLVCNIINK